MIKGIKVVGESALVSSMDRAARSVEHIPTEEAARIIGAAVPAVAPRRTGRLAGSFGAATAGGFGTLTSPVVYAVPIHWGRPAHNIRPNPFVYEARDNSESRYMAAIEHEGQKICDGVHGA